TDEIACEDVMRAAVAQIGSVDILVNNAGIYPRAGPVPDLDWQILQRTIEVNFYAAVRYTMAAARRMQAGGCVVNVSSIESLRPSARGISHYCSSKAALNAFTRSSAVDLAERGIRVNAVLPGLVATEGTQASPKDTADRFALRAPS